MCRGVVNEVTGAGVDCPVENSQRTGQSGGVEDTAAIFVSRPVKRERGIFQHSVGSRVDAEGT